MKRSKIVATEEKAKEVTKLGVVLANDDGKASEAFDSAVAELSEPIRQGIANNDIRADIAQVRAGQSIMDYVRLFALTAEGMAALNEAQIDPPTPKEGEEIDLTGGSSVVGNFNYGYDLHRRNTLSQRLKALAEGPDKYLRKSAEDLAKARGWSFEKALAKVKSLADDDE